MQTSKQRTVAGIADSLSMLGMTQQATIKLAKRLYGGVSSEYLGIPCRVVGQELIMYGKKTVVWDRVLCEIDITL